MNIIALAQYIEEQGGGRRGTDIFVYHMPDVAPDNAIVLFDTLAGSKKDHELVGLHRGKFQVVVRTTDYEAGLTKAQAISEMLTMENAVISDMSVKYMRPRTEPIVYAYSKGDAVEISVTFDTVFVIN